MSNDLSTDFAGLPGAALVVGGSGGLGAEIAECWPPAAAMSR